MSITYDERCEANLATVAAIVKKYNPSYKKSSIADIVLEMKDNAIQYNDTSCVTLHGYCLTFIKKGEAIGIYASVATSCFNDDTKLFKEVETYLKGIKK